MEIILGLILVALIAGALGLRGVSALASNIAWVLFVIALIFFALRLLGLA